MSPINCFMRLLMLLYIPTLVCLSLCLKKAQHELKRCTFPVLTCFEWVVFGLFTIGVLRSLFGYYVNPGRGYYSLAPSLHSLFLDWLLGVLLSWFDR